LIDAIVRDPADDILVVDDDPAIVALLIETLTEAGYAVRQASDGAVALVAITEWPPALLLLDVMMLGLSGPRLLGVLRAREYTFPIVLITAVPALAEPFLDGDRVICIPKPFEIDRLLACVAQYVRLRATS
jgi:adenylate cyclase